MIRVTNKLPSFQRSVYSVLDSAVQEAARDTLIDAKNKAPFLKGALRANSFTKRIKPMHHRVSFWVEYARYQEFGGDNRRTVRRYSTAGTGKHFLRNAGDKQVRKLNSIMRKHARRARP